MSNILDRLRGLHKELASRNLIRSSELFVLPLPSDLRYDIMRELIESYFPSPLNSQDHIEFMGFQIIPSLGNGHNQFSYELTK